jgi:hypothetical protein
MNDQERFATLENDGNRSHPRELTTHELQGVSGGYDGLDFVEIIPPPPAWYGIEKAISKPTPIIPFVHI